MENNNASLRASGSSIRDAIAQQLMHVPEPAPSIPRAVKQWDGGISRKPPVVFIPSDAERDKIFQFKVALPRQKPPIWRRIQVPGEYSFRKLHRVIQAVMGWSSVYDDSHLHQFRVQNFPGGIGPRGLKRRSGGFRAFNEQRMDGKKQFIYQYFSIENTLGTRQCVYEYDFGSTWDFVLTLEAVKEREPGKTYPSCVAGKRASPSEEDPAYSSDEGSDIEDPPDIFEPKKVVFPNLEQDDANGWSLLICEIAEARERETSDSDYD